MGNALNVVTGSFEKLLINSDVVSHIEDGSVLRYIFFKDKRHPLVDNREGRLEVYDTYDNLAQQWAGVAGPERTSVSELRKRRSQHELLDSGDDLFDDVFEVEVLNWLQERGLKTIRDYYMVGQLGLWDILVECAEQLKFEADDIESWAGEKMEAVVACLERDNIYMENVDGKCNLPPVRKGGDSGEGDDAAGVRQNNALEREPVPGLPGPAVSEPAGVGAGRGKSKRTGAGRKRS